MVCVYQNSGIYIRTHYITPVYILKCAYIILLCYYEKLGEMLNREMTAIYA